MARYEGLDLARFIAAVIVLLWHFGSFTATGPAPWTLDSSRYFPWLGDLFWFGWVGVEVFFLLSGFVITTAALNSRPGPFLVRRAIRIFPALWTCALISFFARLAWGEPIDALLNYLVRSALLSPLGPYIDGVVWTLVVEAAFYVFVAIVLAFRAHDRSGRLEAAAIVLGCCSSLYLIALRSSALTQVRLGDEALFEVLSSFGFSVFLLRHGVFFAAGMLINRIRQAGITTGRLCWLAMFVFAGLIELDIRWMGHQPNGAAMLIPGLMTCAIVLFLLITPLRDKPGFTAGGSLTAVLGLLSYTLYLSHFELGLALTRLSARTFSDWPLALAACLTAVFITAYLVMRGPEKWLQGMARRFAYPDNRR